MTGRRGRASRGLGRVTAAARGRGHGRPPRRRGCAAASGSGRASVLRRAGAGAPPGAASRTAARRVRRARGAHPGYPAAGRQGRDRPPDAGASTSCPAAPPEPPDGSSACWSTPGGSSPASSPDARFDGQPREEAFVGVTPRTRPRGSKDAVAYTRLLWVDVDRPRAAARAVGVPGGAAVPPADRERRLGRHARLLASSTVPSRRCASTSEPARRSR